MFIETLIWYQKVIVNDVGATIKMILIWLSLATTGR
jgi:hypothetical protein